MYRNILVTLDGSRLSEAVLPEVERLAAETEARVTLLTVAEPPPAVGERPVEGQQPPILMGMSAPAYPVGPAAVRFQETKGQAWQRVETELTGYLEGKAQPLRDKGIRVETAVRFGAAAAAIIGYARLSDVDLIVMATHGRTGLARLIYGSVAGRVLASGVRPVLLVRPGALE